MILIHYYLTETHATSTLGAVLRREEENIIVVTEIKKIVPKYIVNNLGLIRTS